MEERRLHVLRSPVEVGTRLRKDSGPVSTGRAHKRAQSEKEREIERERERERQSTFKERSPFAIENKKKKRKKKEKIERKKKERNREGTGNKRIRPGGDCRLSRGRYPFSDLGHCSEGALIRHR